MPETNTSTLSNEISKTITEKEFNQMVTELAQLLGWLVYHTWSSIHSEAGFPDLCLVKGKRLIFIELKSAKGIVTCQQQLWLDTLKATGKCEVYLCRPENWDDIVKLLKEV